MIFRHIRPEYVTECSKNADYWQRIFDQWSHIAYTFWIVCTYLPTPPSKEVPELIEKLRDVMLEELIQQAQLGRESKPTSMGLISEIASRALLGADYNPNWGGLLGDNPWALETYIVLKKKENFDLAQRIHNFPRGAVGNFSDQDPKEILKQHMAAAAQYCKKPDEGTAPCSSLAYKTGMANVMQMITGQFTRPKPDPTMAEGCLADHLVCPGYPDMLEDLGKYLLHRIRLDSDTMRNHFWKDQYAPHSQEVVTLSSSRHMAMERLFRVYELSGWNCQGSSTIKIRELQCKCLVRDLEVRKESLLTQDELEEMRSRVISKASETLA
eukprot:4732489-Amphidinium_carterae.1